MKKLQGVARPLFLCLMVLVVFGAYVVRLIQWQLVQGETFLNQSDASTASYIKLTGARGQILDKDGNGLAVNRTTYQITLRRAETDMQQVNDIILKLIEILEDQDEEWIDNLPLELDEVGACVFRENCDSEIAYMKSAAMLNVNSYATAEQCMTQLVEMFDCADYSREDQRRIVSVRYNMVKNQFGYYTPYLFADDVSADTMQILSEKSLELPGVEVQVGTVREYTDGSLAPHIIGQTGYLSQDQYDKLKENGKLYSEDNLSGYTYDDVIGKSGIESAFEEQLRGTSGKEEIEIDSDGQAVKDEITQEPQGGNTVWLTLDSRIQQVANASLSKNVTASAEAGPDGTADKWYGQDCVAGAAVMVDVKTGGLLCASTFPTYDINQYLTDSDYYKQINEDENTPMFNRAFSGRFTPGSTFKPMVAAAALQEGVLTKTSTIHCSGQYTFYDDWQPKCMGTHGTINVVTALQKSCNVFFYETGRLLGIDKIMAYGGLFGLGEETGIEVSENSGMLSNPTDYAINHGVSWTDGITSQAAIGQADNSFTPVQMASYVTAIANDGVRIRLHLEDKITDYTGEEIIEQIGREELNHCGVDLENLKIVQEGMRAVCTADGTGRRLANYGIAVAGKTGTAENGTNHSDNELFIGYAPYEDPQIAIAVVIEYGDKSTYSMNVVEDLLNAYFYGAYVDDDGNIQIPSATSQTAPEGE